MLAPAGLWRAVVHRATADWPVVLAAWLLVLAATTLLAAGVLYGDTVALGGLRRAVLAAPPADRAIVVATAADPADIDALDPVIGAELTQAIATAGGEVDRIVGAGTFADPATARDQVRDLVVVAAYEGIEAHAALAAGRWPEPGRDPIEATLSEAAAAALGLRVGDEAPLVSRLDATRTLRATIVGTWRPDPDDAYWLGRRQELDGVVPGTTFRTHGPLVVTRTDLLARAAGRSVDLEWRGLVSIDGLDVARVDDLRTHAAGVDERLAAAVTPPRRITVVTGLPAALADVGRSILVSRSGVLLLTVQFAVLAGYSLILVAGMLVERRRGELALLRSRGATSAHLVAMAILEAVMLAVPAVIAAPILAVGIVILLGATGPLADTGIVAGVGPSVASVAVALIAGAAAVLALTLPALTSSGNPTAVRAAAGRAGGRTLPQRLGIDLVLVVVAGLALWQLQLYGAPLTSSARGVLGLDPLLIASPAVGLLGGAVLAIRVVPRISEIAERLLGRGRGLVASIGARQIARRPLRYTRAALLLMLAAALGTFAAAHAATWTRSQADQAAYRSATDARVVVADYATMPAWAFGSTYRSVPGVTAATPVTRATLDLGRALRGADLLGIDALAAGRLLRSADGGVPAGTGPVLADLAAARIGAPALRLPGQPRRVAIRLDADLRVANPGYPPDAVPPAWPGIAVAVVLRDADGRLSRHEGGTGVFDAAGQSVVVEIGDPARDLVPAWPVDLLAVELAFSGPSAIPVEGRVDLTGIAVSDDATGEGFAAIAFDPGAPGWSWLRTGPDGLNPYGNPETKAYVPPPGTPGRILFGNGPELAPVIFNGDADPAALFRLWAEPVDAAVLPAVAGTAFLGRSGAKPGDVVEATISGVPMRLRIVAAIDAFPPLDPERPFVVVDEPSLELARFGREGNVYGVEEWWLALDPARAATALATLRSDDRHDIAETIGRAELTRSLGSDPVPLGVIGALGLGSLAAMAFAAIGFVVSAAVSTTERLGEFALLRALGLSGRQLFAWLSIENALLLGFGLVAGSGLGLGLAWLVLPFATLTDTGRAPVPAAEVVIPWSEILPLYLVAAIVLAGTLVALGRGLPGVGLGSILRNRDE